MITNSARRSAVMLGLMLVALAGTASAQATSTATQSVAYEVKIINQIAFSGSPSLIVQTATAGSELDSATATAAWAITTNGGNQKITAKIDSDMPTDVTLRVKLAGTGTSAGFVTLSSADASIVTGISKVALASLGVTYSLNAKASAGVQAAASRTVTYTIAAGA